MTVAIRNATHSDLSQAAATLAVAFESYPWTRWSIPSDDYSARLEQLQAIYLTHAVQHGVVVVSDDLAGVAAMLPPGPPNLLSLCSRSSSSSWAIVSALYSGSNCHPGSRSRGISRR